MDGCGTTRKTGRRGSATTTTTTSTMPMQFAAWHMDPCSRAPPLPMNTNGGSGEEEGESEGTRCRQKRRRIEPTAGPESIMQEVCMYLDSRASAGACASEIDSAVHEALRVLRSCWCFQGNPQDAFEPKRSLSSIAVDLLLTYGRHRITHEDQYLVLSGGEEELPWVGCLMMVLHAYLRTRDRRPQPPPPPPPLQQPQQPTRSPFQSWNIHASLLPNPQVAAEPVGRLVLLNCRGFGWLDSIGNEDYERSSRCLQQVSYTLRELVHDPIYRHAGRPPPPSSSCGGEGEGEDMFSTQALLSRTAVLLSNTIILDGGVSSLSLAAESDTMTAHHQYGRGLACLVPRMTTTTPTTQSSLRQGPCYYTPSTLKPVGCGVRTAPGIAVQAVLLSPLGPLILHAQFEASTTATVQQQQQQRRSSRSCASLHEAVDVTTPYATSNGRPSFCSSPTSPHEVVMSSTFQGDDQQQQQQWWGAASTTALASPYSGGGSEMPSFADRLADATDANATTTGERLQGLLHGGRGGSADTLAAPLLMELCEWVLYLMRAPLPLLVVEWHLDKDSNTSTAHQPRLFHLLEAYAQVTSKDDAMRVVDDHHNSMMSEDGVRQLLGQYHQCLGGGAMDGHVRPFIFAKGLEVVAETERVANSESIISSLQYRRC